MTQVTAAGCMAIWWSRRDALCRRLSTLPMHLTRSTRTLASGCTSIRWATIGRLVPHEVARYAPYQAESPVLGSYGDADHPGAALTIYSEGVLTGTPSVSMQLEGMSDPLQSSRTELDPSGTRLVATFDQAPGYRLEIVQTDSGVGSTLRSPGGFDETRRWVKE